MSTKANIKRQKELAEDGDGLLVLIQYAKTKQDTKETMEIKMKLLF